VCISKLPQTGLVRMDGKMTVDSDVIDWGMWMRRCLELARRAEGRTHPNPMVGAVILRDGVLLAEGWHEGPGTAHAEAMALRKLGQHADNCTVVVNLEPCCHFGRTPPCTDALLAARVRRVVAGIQDPNPIVNGQGFQILREAGVEVITGIEVPLCEALNRQFIDMVMALHRRADCAADHPAERVKG
jgi:diaminohydroxyphosphoribosylaminopyrimidine deaminase / 5-amino-6-(5-phosphoribosylamino)uracil reductase